MSFPGHGPRGCIDEAPAVERYEERLHEANRWILNTVDKTESLGRDAIIIVVGDHGALISGNCTWTDPDVRSPEAIRDNLGILMAVQWPAAYEGQYDNGIHTLMDLSWYLLQYLSGDQLSESDKPSSDSFLVRQSEGRMFKVIEDGMVVSSPDAYEIGESGLTP